MIDSLEDAGIQEVLEKVPIFYSNDSVDEVLKQFKQRGFSFALVHLEKGWVCISSNNLAGVPLMRQLRDADLKPSPTISKNISLSSLLKKLQEAKRQTLIVMDEKKPLGIVRYEKVIEYLLEKTKKAYEYSQQVSAIFKGSPIPIIVVDKDTRVVEISRAVEQEIGIYPEKVIGKVVGEVLRCSHRLDDPRGCGFSPFCQKCELQKSILKTLKIGRPQFNKEVTIPIKIKTDTEVSERVFLINTTPIKKEEEGAVILTLQDITKRKKAEKEEKLLSKIYHLLARRKPGQNMIRLSFEALKEHIPLVLAALFTWESGDKLIKRKLLWKVKEFDVSPILGEIFGKKKVDYIPLEMPPAKELSKQKQVLLIPDLRSGPYNWCKIGAKYNLRSVIFYPLIYREDFKVFLMLASSKVRAFTKEHLKLLDKMKPVFAATIESGYLWDKLKNLNANLEKRIKQRTFELQILYELSKKIGYTLSYNELFQLILRYLHRIVDYDVAASFLNIGKEYEFFIKKVRPLTSKVKLEIKKGIINAFCQLSDVPVEEERLNIKTFKAKNYNPRAPSIKNLASSFTVPLIVNKKTIGMIFVGKEEKSFFSEEQIRILYTLANQASISIQRLQSLLAKEQTRVETAIESMREGVILLDKTRHITAINPRARELLPFLTSTDKDVYREFGGVKIEDIIRLTKAGRHQEIVIQGPPKRIVEVTASFFGKDEGVVVVVDDVTEEREAQRRIEQQERLATIGQLAGGIAHDFNNLLTSIIGFAQLGLMKLGTAHPLRKDLEIIISQGQRASELIRQILDFSRRSITEKKPLNLSSFLKETMKLLRRTLPENILIHWEIQPGDYTVLADPTHIQQLIMNLATNARDAMPNGGTLTFHLKKVLLSKEDVQSYIGLSPGEYVMLKVEDTGCGMNDEVKKHAFEPFFTTKSPGKGTGLGLSQVYGIVKQHNGHIYLESEVGRGTQVIIYLPFFKKGEKIPRADILNIPKGEGQKILLVEDEELVREVGQNMLEKLGYRVLAASNAKEALQIFNSHQGEISLVITDMVMPDMNGGDLYRELNRISPGVKVLLVSGYSLGDEIKKLKAEGVIDYLQKPFQLEVLARKVYEALSVK